MTDLHSHILPGMDTGARSIEESLAMLKLCAEKGVTTILTTPIYRSDRESVKEFIERRNKAYNQLVGRLDNTKRYPILLKGAEVVWRSGIEDLEELSKLCMGRTNYMLLELPCSRWTEEVFESLHRLVHERKIIPVISHIERYLTVMKNPNKILDLLNVGCYTQMNIHSLADETTARISIKLIKHHMIQVLGSDFHNFVKQVPEFREAIENILSDAGEEYLQMLEKNARMLLKNELLKIPVPVGIDISLTF